MNGKWSNVNLMRSLAKMYPLEFKELMLAARKEVPITANYLTNRKEYNRQYEKVRLTALRTLKRRHLTEFKRLNR